MDDRTCKWDGCAKDRVGQGYCVNHYQQARGKGIIEKLPPGPHSLTDVDPVARTATCRTCGPGAPIIKASVDSYTCRTRSREVGAERRNRNREKLNAYHREYARAYKYRMKREALDAILNTEDLACDICEKPLDVRKARIDHDHACCDGRRQTCGECFRGILCNSCNSALGLFADDVERMARAVTYILTRGVRSQSGKHKRSA